MDLIINSLYSDRDIFLRELVSNAADACDKKRFLSITDGTAAQRPEIKIKSNPDDNTLIIEDAGVGMTKDELINKMNHAENDDEGLENWVVVQPKIKHRNKKRIELWDSSLL